VQSAPATLTATRTLGQDVSPIGRERSEASPSKVAVMGQPPPPDHEAAAGAGIAEIEGLTAARNPRRQPHAGAGALPGALRTLAPSARIACRC